VSPSWQSSLVMKWSETLALSEEKVAELIQVLLYYIAHEI
jgi:hypothetical protein